MIYALNGILDYIKENLPALIVLAAIALLIIVLVIVMIVLSVKAKKRARIEAENAAKELESVPPDEEYLPYEPDEVKEEPEEALKPETEPEEAQEEPAETPVPETKEEPEAEPETKEEPAEEKQEEPKEEPEVEKKPEPKKETRKPATKPEPAKKETKKPEPARVSAANGKWVIEAVKGKYWLSLIAPNGQVMLESPTAYATLASARSGIKTYQDNIAAGRMEITEHKNGDTQVQVLNGRGGLLATSSTYSSRSQAESAKESIKRWAATTAIEEIAEKKE